MEIDLTTNMGMRRLLERKQTTVDSEGKVSHMEERTSIVRERREKFMLLYVENYNHLIGLQRKTQEILAVILARKVTYGTNEVILDGMFRAELSQELKSSRQTINNSIAEMVKRKVLQKQKVSGGWRYHLNPYLFGSGEWNTIKEMRQQFTLDYDFHNYKATKTLATITQYDNDDVNPKDVQVIALDEYKDDQLHVKNILLSESDMPKDLGEYDNVAIESQEAKDTSKKSEPPTPAEIPTQPTIKLETMQDTEPETENISERIEYLKLKNKNMELQMQLAKMQLEEKRIDLELQRVKMLTPVFKDQ